MKSRILTLVLGAALLAPVSALAGVVVIANPSVKTESLTADQVAKLYMGRTTSLPDGTAVQPLDLPAGVPARTDFLGKVLDKTEQQLRSYWSRAIFTGKAQPPRQMGNAAEVVRAVASSPGYVGYVDSKDVGAAKVKVLFSAE